MTGRKISKIAMIIKRINRTIKKSLPVPWLTYYYSLRHLKTIDTEKAFSLIINGWEGGNLTFFQRLNLVRRLYVITFSIDCPHTQNQILTAIDAIISVPGGCVVEAGCYKGGSTAKLSIFTKIAKKRLFAFDSFQGIPENSEPHDRNIFGYYSGPFQAGSYRGGLDEVKRNIQRYGEIEVCDLVEGWFDNTMPDFTEEIGVVYLDVDLVASTKTCLKYLYPLIIPGGVLISQDAHLPLIVNLFNDTEFWNKEIGCEKPIIENLSALGLIKITKPDFFQ